MDVTKKFESIAASGSSNPDNLRVLEQELENILSGKLSAPDRQAWLLCRNSFRVKYAKAMTIKRPKIFLGLINHGSYPNFQTVPILDFADIVSLCSPQFYDGRIDRISFNPNTEDFAALLRKLPSQFVPDYYWDPQICGTSLPPYGLYEAPFPTIGGLCHTFRGLNMESLSNYYDYITPISTPFSKLFQSSRVSAHVIDVPVGGNWGSFNQTIEASIEADRDIDLVINFSASTNPEYLDYRKQVHDLCEKFAQKHGSKYIIKFEYGVSRAQYLETMRRAKVVVNACSYNGPYNYRTFEVINSGAVLMQIKTQYAVDQSLNDYLQPDLHYIEFDVNNFESKLLKLLGDEKKRKHIQTEAYQFLNSNFSLKEIHRQILARVTQDKNNNCLPAKKDEFDSLLCWMHTLATSPVHHRLKREIFAKMAVSSGMDEPLTIRYTMMALPILANMPLGNTLILESELRTAFETSLETAVRLLCTKLEAMNDFTVLDKWFYTCIKCMSDMANESEVEVLLEDINSCEDCLRPERLNSTLLDLDVSDDDFIALKKSLLDIPTMTYIGDDKKRIKITKQYLTKVLDYFSKSMG